jgi:hypothetical protein
MSKRKFVSEPKIDRKQYEQKLQNRLDWEMCRIGEVNSRPKTTTCYSQFDQYFYFKH